VDSITQAALGAAIGQATLGKRMGGKAVVAGAIVATIPDLDVFLRFFYSSYDMLRIHRGLSHSFLFGILVAGLLVVLLKRLKWFRDIDALRLYWFSVLCLVTHALLDYCTAYGTQLLLPFSDARLGLDIINVVDPVYTIPLLLGTLGGMYIPRLKSQMFGWNMAGILVSSAYLVLTFFLKQHMNERLASDLALSGIEPSKSLTMPVGMASLNWYGVAKADDGIYMKQYSVLEDTANDFYFFPQNNVVLNRLDKETVNTMQWFAKGFYTAEKVGDTIRVFNLQVDMRGMVMDRMPPAPTKGYFEFVLKPDGTFDYGYGNLN
jgi:inner membrane protein